MARHPSVLLAEKIIALFDAESASENERAAALSIASAIVAGPKYAPTVARTAVVSEDEFLPQHNAT